MKKENVFKFSFFLLFLFFVFLYVIGGSGLYEYKLNEKKVLTEEKIKQFEEDLNNGVPIDINHYLTSTKKDYDNVFTKTSKKIAGYVNKGFQETFKYLFKYLKD